MYSDNRTRQWGTKLRRAMEVTPFTQQWVKNSNETSLLQISLGSGIVVHNTPKCIWWGQLSMLCLLESKFILLYHISSCILSWKRDQAWASPITYGMFYMVSSLDGQFNWVTVLFSLWFSEWCPCTPCFELKAFTTSSGTWFLWTWCYSWYSPWYSWIELRGWSQNGFIAPLHHHFLLHIILVSLTSVFPHVGFKVERERAPS